MTAHEDLTALFDCPASVWPTPARDTPLVLYGAGQCGRTMLRGLRGLGYNVVAFTDSTPSLWGTDIDGVRIMAPSSVGLWGTVTVVSCLWNFGSGSDIEAVRKAIAPDVPLIGWPDLMMRHPETFLPYWSLDRPERIMEARGDIEAAFSLFTDEESRALFVRDLAWRLRPNLALQVETSPLPYFDPALMPLTDHEVFFDCGAYDGDSARAFIAATGDRYEKILCFESDFITVFKLAGWCRSYQGDVRGGRVVPFYRKVSDDKISRKDEIAIDSLRIIPTLIKMDIEGAEWDALHGAEETIRRHRPKLAICVYHHCADLWRIPLYIAGLGDYTFRLAHHGQGISDTVLYCLPREGAA